MGDDSAPLIRNWRRCAAAWAGALAFGFFAGACADKDGAGRDVVQERVHAALQAADEVPVIVSFRDPEAGLIRTDRHRHRQLIRAAGDSLLARHLGGFAPVRRFEHVPAVAGRLSRRALDALARDPNVSFIQVDGTGEGALTVSVPAIGADVAKAQFHVTGKGIRMAVLDTGVNATHPDLGSSVVATQHCFTRNACPPNNASEGTSADDDHGHGSHVSGIVTSDGQVAGAGFAPDVEIVAVKINDRNDSGFESDWVAGLDWVFSNLATLRVKVVNLSICTNQLYAAGAACDANQPALARAVKNLVDAGVTLFAASGNRGSSSQLSAPACNTGVIAVGATYKSNQGRQPQSGTFQDMWGQSFAACADGTTAFDKVACFTNSNARLDIVAPGAVIVSDSLGTRTEQYRGTSQASPTAAGVAALMLECNPSLNPAEIKSILIRTAVYVTDPKNGLEFPSIRADAAVREACGGGADGGTSNDAGANDAGANDASAAGAGGRGGSSAGNGGRGGAGGGAGAGVGGGFGGRSGAGGSAAGSDGGNGGTVGGGGGAGGRGGGGGTDPGAGRGGDGAGGGSGGGGATAAAGRGGDGAGGRGESMTDGSATGCGCDAGPHDRAPRSLLITFGVAMFVLRRGRCSSASRPWTSTSRSGPSLHRRHGSVARLRAACGRRC